MNNYLSDIVARNAPDHMPPIMFAINKPAIPDIDPFSQADIKFFNDVTDGGQTLSDKKPFILREHQPIATGPITPASSSQVQHTNKKFIDTYTNRLSANEITIHPNVSKKAEPISKNIDAQDRTMQNDALQPTDLLAFHEAAAEQANDVPVQQKLNPFNKKEIATPSLKIVTRGNDKIFESVDKHPVLRPRVPIEVSNQKINKEAPKLVIGKITIEILPSPIPNPTKIIHKYVNVPAENKGSKINTRSFGLSQL